MTQSLSIMSLNRQQGMTLSAVAPETTNFGKFHGPWEQKSPLHFNNASKAVTPFVIYKLPSPFSPFTLVP
jgi:hypothetical protein